jgi:tetratricopeptide (TPR) repeat protein
VLQEQSLALWRELGDRLNVAASLNALGSYACDRGEYDNARAYLEQGLALRRELGHRGGIAASLNNLAVLADYEGDVDRAEALLHECLAIQRELSDWRGVSCSLANLGYSANKRGDRTTALRLFSQTLEIQARLGIRAWVALSLQGVAQLAADCDSPIVGATLIGAADRVRTDINPSLNHRNRSEHEALTRRLRALLGDAVFDLAWKEGADMPPDEAVGFAQTRLLRQQAISSPPGAVG